MEFVLMGTVLGAGYMLSKGGKNRKFERENLIEPEPSTTNIYTSNNINKVKKEIVNRVDSNFQKSKNAINTNIIPPQFNNRIFNNQNNSIKYLQYPDKINNTENDQIENKFISSLSGESLNIEEFTHNNMTPFFGGSIKQNMYEYANQPILELHTGTDKANLIKKESKPFFEPKKNINNVFGTQTNTAQMLNRYLPSQKKQNELPIEKIIVGPGLNNGYTNEPSGGFHQANTRDFLMPKSVDQKRVLTNPKITYKGRIIAGKSLNQNRKVIGKVKKYRPETTFKHGHKKLFTTVGAYTKEKKKSCIIMPDTNRKKSMSYTGPSAPASQKKDRVRGKYRNSTKNIFTSSGPRNINLEEKWKNNKLGDYGKKAINLPANERDITGQRTHITNLTSIVKALVAPIQDIFRTTRKENAIGNIRQSGNINVARPKNHTTRDPNDIARTTIKETNIHNNRLGNLAGNNKLTIYDPNDIARTTIKETNIHDNRTGNMSGNTKSIVYDPNDVSRTTIKETNIHNNRTGFMGVSGKGQVYDPNDIARTTIKETNIHDSRTGNIGARSRGQVYDPNDIARTTIKETNIHDTRTGNMGNNVNRGLVYDKNEIKAKITTRNTMEPEETVLNMKNINKLTTYDPNDLARTTIKETNIHDTRSGNVAGINKQYVYDPNDIARTTIKETNIHDNRTANINNLANKNAGYLTNEKIAPNTNRQFSTGEYTGNMAGDVVNGGGGSGYLTNNNNAPNTNRQFSSTEYTGTADSINNKPRSYQDILNMTLNEVREGTLKGRNPVNSNVSLTNGSDVINMESKKIENDYINNRPVNSNKIYSDTKQIRNCSVTTFKNQLDNDKIANRIEPQTLNAFKNNPYSQPLDSHAFP